MIETMVSFIAAFVSTIASIIYFWTSGRFASKKYHSMTEKLANKVSEEIEVGLFGPLKISKAIKSNSDLSSFSSAELVQRIEQQILARMATLPGVTQEEIQKEVHSQLCVLQERISKIESRFPEEAKLEKIASINDALLSERIDQLAKQVENLERRILSKCDVALIVSTIILGITFIVGATYAVMQLILKAP
jgi:hypothetical protein